MTNLKRKTSNKADNKSLHYKFSSLCGKATDGKERFKVWCPDYGQAKGI